MRKKTVFLLHTQSVRGSLRTRFFDKKNDSSHPLEKLIGKINPADTDLVTLNLTDGSRLTPTEYRPLASANKMPPLAAPGKSRLSNSSQESNLVRIYAAHFADLISKDKTSHVFYEKMQTLSPNDRIVFWHPDGRETLTLHGIHAVKGFVSYADLATFLYYLAPNAWKRLASSRQQIRLDFVGHSMLYLQDHAFFGASASKCIQTHMDNFLIDRVVDVNGYDADTLTPHCDNKYPRAEFGAITQAPIMPSPNVIPGQSLNEYFHANPNAFDF